MHAARCSCFLCVACTLLSGHFAQAQDSPEEAEFEFATEVEVDALPLRTKERAASDITIDQKTINAAPRQEVSDLLSIAPGFYVSTPESNAIGQAIIVRGFDAEHGQDIEFRLNGIPLNQPSHIHGQGYTDFNFLIPDSVRELHVIEGVNDPQQGDFAVGGSVNYTLGIEERGVHLRSGFGSFRSFRNQAIWAPENYDPDTFVAARYLRTQGFGEERAGQSGDAIAQYGFSRGSWHWHTLGVFHAAQYDSPGVVRRDDVAAGTLGFYDAYNVASADKQDAWAARVLLAFGGDRRSESGKNMSLQTWLGFNDFRLHQNYTGFLTVLELDPGATEGDDLFEQRNRAYSAGVQWRERSKTWRPSKTTEGSLEGGVETHVDFTQQDQNLLYGPANDLWPNRIDLGVTGLDVGVWLDNNWDFTPYFSMRIGVRSDLLFYSTNNHLSAVPASPDEPPIADAHNNSVGITAGPRLSLEGRPLPWLNLTFAYGEGLRSAQAQTLQADDNVSYTRVRSLDAGVKVHDPEEKQWQVRLSGFRTHVDNDTVFEATEAQPEQVGPTLRVGAILFALVRPVSWLQTSLSGTYVRATLEEPVPGESDRIPQVPAWVVRGDLSAEHKIGKLGKKNLIGRAGTSVRYISEQPLSSASDSPAFALWDLSTGLRWHFLDLQFDVFNVLDKKYAQNEFEFSSQWDRNQPASDARHTIAGAPRTFLFTLGIDI